MRLRVDVAAELAALLGGLEPALEYGIEFEQRPGLSEAQRAELRRQGKSILDFVVADIGRLRGRLGKDDRGPERPHVSASRSRR